MIPPARTAKPWRMEFGIIMLALTVGFFVHRAVYRKETPLLEAKKSLREGKSIHAENIVLRHHRKVVAKHGEESLETARSANDLALIVLLGGEARRAQELLEPALKTLRKAGETTSLAQALCTRAMIFTATDADMPAFVDLDDLTEIQLQAVAEHIAENSPELPPVLAAPLLANGIAFLSARATEEIVKPLREVAAELVRKEQMAMALQLQAEARAKAEEGCGDGGCSTGGCGSGPAGEVDQDLSQAFAKILFASLPEGMVKGVEMRQEGDRFTPRVQVARELSADEERQLKVAIGEAMASLQGVMSAPAQPTAHG